MTAKDFVRTALIHEDVELATLNRLITSKMTCEEMIVPTASSPRRRKIRLIRLGNVRLILCSQTSLTDTKQKECYVRLKMS